MAGAKGEGEGGGLGLGFNLDSIYNSNDQRRFFNTMECDHTQGEGKGAILRNFIFLDRSLS